MEARMYVIQYLENDTTRIFNVTSLSKAKCYSEAHSWTLLPPKITDPFS